VSIDDGVPCGLDLTSERREMLSDALDVIDDGNVAAILQEAHETADAADVLGADEHARTVAGTAAPVSGEAGDHRVVDGCQGNAPTLEPGEEVSRRAALERECLRWAGVPQVIQERSNQPVLWAGAASLGRVAIRGRVLSSHVGPFG
jgi:hypothetical protein